MKVCEYLMEVMEFMLVSIFNADLTIEVVNMMLANGYSPEAKFLKGKFNGHTTVFIPMNGLKEHSKMLAAANMDTGRHVFVDADVWGDEFEEFYLQLLAHEVEHLKRGSIDVKAEDIKTLNDLGGIYLEEEQIINAKVAPIMFDKYEELVANITTSNWINDPIGQQLVQGGVLALYNKSAEHKEVISRLIKNTCLEEYVKNLWG